MSLSNDLTAASDLVHQQHRDAADLFEAAVDGKLEFHFQPILKDGRIVSAEALVRWRQPDGSLRFPGPWLDALGYDDRLDDLFHRQLLCAAAELSRALPDVRINLNVVPARVAQQGWADRELSLLLALGVEPDQFTFEITEGSLLPNTILVLENLGRIREAGCHVALDDFGEGQANLVSFMDFHELVDTVKIDKRLVQHEDQRAAQCLISFSRSFGKHVVAEGVETEDQAAWLRSIGVRCHQGWLYAKAMPVSEFILFEEGCRK